MRLRLPYVVINALTLPVSPGSEHAEQGLLGLAFHPDFQTNSRFYLHYTPSGAAKNVVAEWSLKFDEPYEVRRLVEVDDPHPANNGGMLTFGPDDLLYVGMGDGGGTGDPHGLFGNAQSGDTVLGSILRIDVDAPSRDFAPTNNPYIDKVGHPYIWAKGLRNPWRFSFDTATGALYVADEGQWPSHFLNLGWRAFEGFSVYDDDLTDMCYDCTVIAAAATSRHSHTATVRSSDTNVSPSFRVMTVV